MCILLLCALSGALYAVSALIWAQTNKGIDPTTIIEVPPFGIFFNAGVFFFAVYWGCDMIVHGIFAVNYWIASRKVLIYIESRPSPYF